MKMTETRLFLHLARGSRNIGLQRPGRGTYIRDNMTINKDIRDPFELLIQCLC